MRFLKHNLVFVVIFIALVSIKFYYLHLADKSKSYNKDVIYSNGDAGHYYIIAENIFNYNVFADNNSNVPSQSATWRPPLYPFLLSLLFNISTNPFLVMIYKSLIEISLIVFALYLFRKKASVQEYYIFPFLLLFVEPQYLKYSITFLSESLSAVLILLLSILFILANGNKKYAIIIPILSGLIVLCHPVSVFFVLIIFTIYLVSLLKSNFKMACISGLIFSMIVLSWPFRNLNTFHEGFYFTASQGATFAKGWNEKLATQFTNVDGDLADESMNLKYLNKSIYPDNPTFLENSKLYKMATWEFIKTLSIKEKLQIVLKKIKSNFIPYPEKPKAVFIENVAIFFRMLYLFVFLQMVYRFLKGNFSFESKNDRTFMIVFSIFCGQIIMSIYIYTGLRFNAVFGLALLFSFIYLNLNYISAIVKHLKLLIDKKYNSSY